MLAHNKKYNLIISQMMCPILHSIMSLQFILDTMFVAIPDFTLIY